LRPQVSVAVSVLSSQVSTTSLILTGNRLPCQVLRAFPAILDQWVHLERLDLRADLALLDSLASVAYQEVPGHRVLKDFWAVPVFQELLVHPVSHFIWFISGVRLQGKTVKGGNPSQSYGASPWMWDHTACHPTQVNAPRLKPSQAGHCSIYLSGRDKRLSN